VLRKITPVETNWVVSTIPATMGFQFGNIAVDGAGSIYAPAPLRGEIHKIVPEGTNWVRSIIGGGDVQSSTDGAGTAAKFNNPDGAAVDSAGQVFVADTFNNTIRKGVLEQYAPIVPSSFTRPP